MEAWHLLEITFQAVLEASIDAKLSRLQEFKLQKVEKVVAYSSSVVKLVTKLESKVHTIRHGEETHALARNAS